MEICIDCFRIYNAVFSRFRVRSCLRIRKCLRVRNNDNSEIIHSGACGVMTSYDNQRLCGKFQNMGLCTMVFGILHTSK